MSLDLLLPYYGDPAYLRTLVRSVRAQTRPDWRLVVVDDAWPGEDVRPWLASLADDRISYHRNPVNLGINANFSRCLGLARSTYVAFPGGDDLLLPSYVATVLAAAERTGADIVQPGVVVIDREGHEVLPLADRVKSWLAPSARHGDVVLVGEALVSTLATGNWAYFPALCWRREPAQAIGFHRGLDTALDLRLLLELAFAGASLAVVAEPAFVYRRHEQSFSQLTARTFTRFEEETAVLDWAARQSRARGWHRAARRARWRPTSRLHAASLLPTSLRERGGNGRRLLAHSLGHSPGRA